MRRYLTPRTKRYMGRRSFKGYQSSQEAIEAIKWAEAQMFKATGKMAEAIGSVQQVYNNLPSGSEGELGQLVGREVSYKFLELVEETELLNKNYEALGEALSELRTALDRNPKRSFRSMKVYDEDYGLVDSIKDIVANGTLNAGEVMGRIVPDAWSVVKQIESRVISREADQLLYSMETDRQKLIRSINAWEKKFTDGLNKILDAIEAREVANG